MEKLIQQFISRSTDVTLLAACVVGVVRYRRFADPGRRYLVWLSLLALVVTVLSMLLAHYRHANLVLAPIDAAIEFTLLGLIYRRALWPSAVARALPLVIGAFLVGTALTFRPSLDVAEFSPVQHFIESVLVLTLVGIYFRRLLVLPMSMAPLEHEPMFWISTGLLLYFSGNILIFLTSNVTLQLSRQLAMGVWAIHALLYSFLNCFFVVAFLVVPQPEPRQPPAGKVTQS